MRLLKSLGQSISAIARALGIARNTVRYNLCRGPPSTREVPLPPKPTTLTRRRIHQRRKRVKALTKEKIAVSKPRCVRVVCKHPSCGRVARALSLEGVCVSKSTVHRDMRAIGLVSKKRPTGPRWRPPDAPTRVAFCQRALSTFDPRALCFCDEKYVDADDHSCSTQWCDLDEWPEPRSRDVYSMKVQIWGLVGVGLKVLVLLPRDARLNAEMYIRKCLSPVVCAGRLAGRTFIQDNARPHVAKRTLAYLEKRGVRTVDWPARSPDLNPIENIWAILSTRVSDRLPTNATELENYTVQEWDRLEQSTVDKFVLSFFSKAARCITAKGKFLRQAKKFQGERMSGV